MVNFLHSFIFWSSRKNNPEKKEVEKTPPSQEKSERNDRIVEKSPILKLIDTDRRSILENVGEVIYTLDKSGRITYANGVITKYGFKMEEVLGKRMLSFVPKRYWPTLLKDFASVIRGNNAIGQVEIITPIGKKFAEHKSAPIWDEKGRIIGVQTILHDITEWKRITEELEESKNTLELRVKERTQDLENLNKQLKNSEDMLKLLFEFAPDAIYLSNLKGTFIDGNKAAEKILGYPREKLIGQNFLKLKLLPTSQLNKAARLLALNALGRPTGPDEFILNTGNGTSVSLEIRTHPIKVHDETIVIGIARDLSERKLLKGALGESEARYRELCEEALVLILKTGLDGNIVYVNNVVEKYGFQKSDLIGKNIQSFVPKKNWLKLASISRKISSGNESQGNIDIKTPLGKITVEYLGRPWIEEQNIVGGITIIRDITERKAMEQEIENYTKKLEQAVDERTKELKDSEEKIRSIFESSPNSIMVVDNKGKIEDCIDATIKLHDFSSKNEIIGKSIFDLISEKDRKKVADIFEKTTEETTTKNLEYTLLTRNGKEFPADFSLSTIRNSKKENIGFVIIASDISIRKNAEKELIHHSEHLEELVEERTKKLKESEKLAAIGELATMVAHDLRNPLQGIANATYYIKKNVDSQINNQKLVKTFELLEESIEYSDKIVSDLLDYSREIKINLSSSNCKMLVNKALSMIAIPKYVDVSNFTCEKPEIMIDFSKLTRVFVNFITNAIDAMPQGGSLVIEQRSALDYTEIVFKDTGVGISEDNLKKMWKPLFTTKAKGMGLGLAICRRIIESHGGRVSVNSHLGKGSTFSVILPCILRNKESEKTPNNSIPDDMQVFAMLQDENKKKLLLHS